MITANIRTKDGTELIRAYSVPEIELPSIKYSNFARNKRTIEYALPFGCLDTETSHEGENCGWIYQWAVNFAGCFIYGRKPSEFIDLLIKMKEFYHLSSGRVILFYVHNLSYDFQYLKHYLKGYDPNIKVMATDAHSVLIVDVLGFRFLCSYRLTGLSLDALSRAYSVHYLKAVGEIDYNIVRYQDSDLTLSDWLYMFSDVASQHDAVEQYMKVRGFTYAFEAPFTSTGFVRRDCRKESERSLNWHKKFINSRLSLTQYKTLKQAFMGGLTIASWAYMGETVRSGVDGVESIGHKDFTSSYPARQMLDYFPIGRPMDYGTIKDVMEFETLIENFCCIFYFSLDHVQIKAGVTAPYIPSSKCIYYENIEKINGKVVYADTLTIAVTEIDYKWIKRQYTGDNMRIFGMICFKRGDIPKWMKNRIMDYFKKKCTLKKSDPRLYMASKANLNGIYGMTATSIIRDQFLFNDDCIIDEDPDQDEFKQIENFYMSRNSFMPFQFGVYTTAWARDALMKMIEAVGYDNFLYCDTDSVFYIKTEENEKNLQKMNDEIQKRAAEAGAVYENNILGLATDEPEIRAFRALHAKCYAMEEKQGDDFKLSVTIAGIPKSSIKWINGQPVKMTNAEELGAIDNLESGFTFHHNGGVRILYLEQPMRKQMINGHDTEISSSAIILNIDKIIDDGFNTRINGILQHLKMQY